MTNTKINIYQNLHEQYRANSIDTALMKVEDEFTIFNLKDLKRKMPSSLTTSRLNFFVFGFVKGGTGSYQVDDKTFDLKPNTVYFINPGHLCSFKYSNALDYTVITLSEGFLKENVNKDIYNKFPYLMTETFPAVTLTKTKFVEFERLFKIIHAESLGNSAYRKKMVATLFVVLLHKFTEHCLPGWSAIHEQDKSSEIVKSFKRSLELHYRALTNGEAKHVFRIQDYADIQNIHPNYLSSIIKAKTGKAIGEWINDKTITEAKALLQSSAVNIKEISGRLGFSNSANFSNYFKKNTKQTPAEFRKIHRYKVK